MAVSVWLGDPRLVNLSRPIPPHFVGCDDNKTFGGKKFKTQTNAKGQLSLTNKLLTLWLVRQPQLKFVVYGAN